MASNPRETAGDRLRAARERAGYGSAMEFSRAVGVNATTYAHHENGRRTINTEVAKLYARFLNLPVGTLLAGEELPAFPPIPIVARIGAQGRVQDVTSKSGTVQKVELPAYTIDLVAAPIVGDDLYPAYRDGDVVFYRDPREERFNPEELSGCVCMVELNDGRKFVRKISAQPNGRFTLIAFRHDVPDLFDQIIVRASPIELVQHALPPRLSNR